MKTFEVKHKSLLNMIEYNLNCFLLCFSRVKEYVSLLDIVLYEISYKLICRKFVSIN
jgi:hypothetical protein